MAIKKGDILDERKRFPDSCGLVVKVAGGGEGFQKILCCGHGLTEEDVVPDIISSRGRKKGALLPGAMLEEKRQFPDSCGLRLMVIDGMGHDLPPALWPALVEAIAGHCRAAG